MKALRTWNSAFPQLSTCKHIKGFFIEVVSGKKKFTGVNTFSLVDDGTKYWSTSYGDKPSKSFPLLDSWEDVILLKKAKLYLAEIYLRNFRLRRKYPETYEENNCNILHWSEVTEENQIDNNLRADVNLYWTEVFNLSKTLEMESPPLLLPEEAEHLNTKSYFQKGYGRKEHGNTGIENGMTLYESILEVLQPYDSYFKTKYGIDMLFVRWEELRGICGISEDKLKFYAGDKREKRFEIPGVGISLPGINLDKFVSDMVKESNREELVSEEVKTTEWTSGYISPEGEFYGCSDLQHVNFSTEICKMKGYIKNTDAKKGDCQRVLEDKGWVTVSRNRFYWGDIISIKQSQIDAIWDYCQAKKIDKTIFNKIGKEMTFSEAFE